jgi:hypothetical protein
MPSNWPTGPTPAELVEDASRDFAKQETIHRLSLTDLIRGWLRKESSGCDRALLGDNIFLAITFRLHYVRAKLGNAHFLGSHVEAKEIQAC